MLQHLKHALYFGAFRTQSDSFPWKLAFEYLCFQLSIHGYLSKNQSSTNDLDFSTEKLKLGRRHVLIQMLVNADWSTEVCGVASFRLSPAHLKRWEEHRERDRNTENWFKITTMV